MESTLLRLLAYFDVFSYPLTREELLRYAGEDPKNPKKADKALCKLERSGLISSHNGYYIAGKDLSLIERRRKGNQRTGERMKDATRYSRIIAAFPFVRGVFLSGSISKGYMSENDDIDYFIVTAPGRLWLVRSLLTLYKKIFLGNSHHNFCINYFVDTKNLKINEINRFTATEIYFLTPMYGCHLLHDIIKQNQWVKSYYPVFKPHTGLKNDQDKKLKHFLESILKHHYLNRLERYLFRFSRKYIRNKYRRMNPGHFGQAFSIKENELRYNPGAYQKRILQRYCWKLRIMEKKLGDSLLAGMATMPFKT